MSHNKEYQRLAGRGRRAEGNSLVAGRQKTCSLWLAADHLLLIEGTTNTQDYKRFYYRDIQAILVRKTINGKVWNGVLSALGGVLFLLGFAVDEKIGAGFLWGIGGFFLLLFLINWLCGPTCVTHLKTAVQTEELPSLKRLKVMKKAMAALRSRIEEAQGVLDPMQAQAQGQQVLQTAFSTPENSAAMHRVLSLEKRVSRYQGRVHLMLFWLLLVDGFFAVMQIFFHAVPVLLLSTFVTLGASGMAVVALIRQHETDLMLTIRRLTWGAAGYFAISMVMGYASFIALTRNDAEPPVNQFEILQRYSQLAPLETPWLLGALTFSAVVSIVIGALGLLLLKRFERERREQSPAPATVLPPTETPSPTV